MIITIITRKEFEIERKMLIQNLYISRENDYSEKIENVEKITKNKFCDLYSHLKIEDFLFSVNLFQKFDELNTINEMFNFINQNEIKINCETI